MDSTAPSGSSHPNAADMTGRPGSPSQSDPNAVHPQSHYGYAPLPHSHYHGYSQPSTDSHQDYPQSYPPPALPHPYNAAPVGSPDPSFASHYPPAASPYGYHPQQASHTPSQQHQGAQPPPADSSHTASPSAPAVPQPSSHPHAAPPPTHPSHPHQQQLPLPTVPGPYTQHSAPPQPHGPSHAHNSSTYTYPYNYSYPYAYHSAATYYNPSVYYNKYYPYDLYPGYILNHDHRNLMARMRKKEVKRRTKTGCLTCRKRRIKCDETHPTCNNCRKSRRDCLGYSTPVNGKQDASGTAGMDGKNSLNNPTSGDDQGVLSGDTSDLKDNHSDGTLTEDNVHGQVRYDDQESREAYSDPTTAHSTTASSAPSSMPSTNTFAQDLRGQMGHSVQHAPSYSELYRSQQDFLSSSQKIPTSSNFSYSHNHGQGPQSVGGSVDASTMRAQVSPHYPSQPTSSRYEYASEYPSMSSSTAPTSTNRVSDSHGAYAPMYQIIPSAASASLTPSTAPATSYYPSVSTATAQGGPSPTMSSARSSMYGSSYSQTSLPPINTPGITSSQTSPSHGLAPHDVGNYSSMALGGSGTTPLSSTSASSSNSTASASSLAAAAAVAQQQQQQQQKLLLPPGRIPHGSHKESSMQLPRLMDVGIVSPSSASNNSASSQDENTLFSMPNSEASTPATRRYTYNNLPA